MQQLKDSALHAALSALKHCTGITNIPVESDTRGVRYLVHPGVQLNGSALCGCVLLSNLHTLKHRRGAVPGIALLVAFLSTLACPGLFIDIVYPTVSWNSQSCGVILLFMCPGLFVNIAYPSSASRN